AAEAGERLVALDCRLEGEPLREPAREMPCEEGRDGAGSALQALVPDVGVRLRPRHEQFLAAPAVAPPDGEMGRIEDRRAAPPAVREEEAAPRLERGPGARRAQAHV